MIRLDIEKYCHSCPEFNADVKLPPVYYSDDGEQIIYDDTIIRCRNAVRCEKIYNHLVREAKK